MIKKIITMLILFTCTLSVLSLNCFANTVFSVRSDKTYYGKNWDWDFNRKKDVVFTMQSYEDGLLILDIRLSDSGFLCTSLNNKGLFASCNATTGVKGITDMSRYAHNINIADLREDSTTYVSKVSQIINRVNERGIYCPGYQEHVFFSDIDGNACVVATDNEKTSIVKDENQFLVATNFPLNTLKSLGDLDNAPCERYKAAYQYIEDKTMTFSFEDGVEVLKRTIQSDRTIYSILCDPKENVAYLFLDQDFNRIWKISFETKSISTYKGFKNNTEFKFNSQGINFMQLESYQEIDGNIKYSNTVDIPKPTIDQNKSIVHRVPIKTISFFPLAIVLFIVFVIIGLVVIFVFIINITRKS